MTGTRRAPRNSAGSKLHGDPGAWSAGYSQERGRYGLLPSLCQFLVRLGLVPLGLLQDIRNGRLTKGDVRRFHRVRTRSRSAVIKPFLRISAIDTSILGPRAAASSSCSRLAMRRSLSWRINSRTYSLGVPQSPEATWPST